jgi:uncharacterized cupredoxin-like copper-binding protein
MTWTKVRAAGLVAAAAVMAAACGKASAEQAPQQARTQAAEQAAPPQVVTVVARDYSFEAPAEVQAGLVTFQLQNRGQQLHHMAVLRLDQGKTMQDLFAAMQSGGGKLPEWAHEVGGPNAPDPGGDANATMLLQPGNYALLCFVDIPDRVPHVMKGMVKPLRVVAPAATPAAAQAVTGDVTMTLSDYAFALSAPITAGRHTIRVENPTAAQSHEVELVKLAPGKTLQDLMSWIENPQGPSPGQAIGGIAGLAKGEVASFAYDFAPGEYGWICFLPGPDGRPHFMHGMMQQFTVS